MAPGIRSSAWWMWSRQLMGFALLASWSVATVESWGQDAGGATGGAAGGPADVIRLTADGRWKRDAVFVDGAQAVVFTYQQTPVQWRLMRLKLAERSITPLHEDVSRSEFEPAFSQDGRFYAFVQSRGNLSLALVVRDTLNNTEAEVKPAGGFSGLRSPAVSPDGKRVFYCFPVAGRQHIFSINMQAQDRKQITDSPGVNNWPDFSPDGSRVVFGSTRDDNYEIYVMHRNGTHVRRLTYSETQDIRPSFSPDGKRIAFTSSRDGNYEIYLINADGTGLRRVTQHPERDDYASWHPNGKQLLTVAERDGRHDLYLIPVPQPHR